MLTPSQFSQTKTNSDKPMITPSEFSQLSPMEQSGGQSLYSNKITDTRTKIVGVDDPKSFKEYGVDTRFSQGDWFDQRAQNQSVGEDIWNGAVRLVGSTGTKLMSGIGYLGGFAGYAATGFSDISKMTDNGFSAYFDGLEKDLKDANPIYKPSWVANGNFFDKATALSFWMDEGVDGAAYMLSSLIPGAGISKGLQLGTKIARIIGAGAKVAGAIDTTVITALSTISEAAQEAHGVQQRVRSELQSQVDAGRMSQAQMETKAAEAARNDFLINGLILLGPNAMESKWFFGNAAKAAERNVLKKIVDDAGNIISDVGPVTKRLVAKEMLKKAAIGVASEGLWEENAQLATENWAVDNATGKEDTNMSGILKNMAENFTTTDGQVSMFLGGIMGLGGGAVGGFRSGRAEVKSIKNAQAKLTGVNATYTADLKNTIRDLYEKETVNGIDQFKKDEQGNLIINKEKAVEVFDKLKSKRDIETLKQVALLTGKKDMFEVLQNVSFSNMAIEHLMYGEGSLEILNKRIDNVAEENKKEYEDIFGMLGEEDKMSIDKVKEDQKKIAKVIYESLEREKDFAGVWEAPEFKNKDELKQYDIFVQNMIGNKALADSRIAFANQKLSQYKEEADRAREKVTGLQGQFDTLQQQLSTLEEYKKVFTKKDLTEAEKELKDSFQRDSYNGNNITKAELEKEIKRTQREIEDIDGYLPSLKDDLETQDQKIEELVNSRAKLKQEYGDLTNNSLKKKIQEEWTNRKVEEEKVAEKVEKAEEAKAEEIQTRENSTSEGTGATDRTTDALQKELDEKQATYDRLAEFIGEDDPEVVAMFNKIIELREKITAMKNGATASEVQPATKEKEAPASIVTPNIDIDKDYDSTVSHTMTTKDELNPEKSASKTADINFKMKNALSGALVDDNASTYSNVVMHKQLEHVLVNSGKIRYFYFKNDENGNPIPSNQSGVDFDFVNSSESLQPGAEIEFRLTEVSKERQDAINSSINIEKARIKEAALRGVKVDESDNYGFGDTTKHIGIYAEDKLIGFVQLPKMFSEASPSTKAQQIARQEIVAERKAIIERLAKGEKVTTTVQQKGKGNYFSRSEKGRTDGSPSVTNQDNTIITPEIRAIDQLEGQSIFGVYKDNGSGGNWDIPTFSTKADTRKALELMRLNVNEVGGFNGQVALMVKTANGTWSPIPVFTNTLSESLQTELWDKLVANKNEEAKVAIANINDIAYASIDDSAMLRIFPFGTDTMLSIGAVGPINLKDIDRHEQEIKEEIKSLRANIVANKINNKEYQEKLAENKALTTNVVTVGGHYFLQPFILFDSILSEEEKEAEPELKSEEEALASSTDNVLEIDMSTLTDLGINPTGYVSTLDATPENKDVIWNKRSYTVEDGIVKDNSGTIIRTESIRAGVLKAEALQNNFFIDVSNYRVLAVLTNKKGVSKREIKIVSLQNNREVTSKLQKAEIAQANPAIGEFIKKFCI